MTQSPKHFLEMQFRKLKLLRNVPDEPEAIRAWAELMEPLLEEVGEERFGKAVMNLCGLGGFFPRTADEIRAALPHDKPKFCPMCDGSRSGGAEGFVIVDQMRGGKVIKVAQKCTHNGGE